MKYNRWLKSILISSTAVVLFVFSINYFVDPANFFSHEHALNKWRISFDERLQKTAYLTNKLNVDDVDTLLFGSSRNTYYDQSNFEGMSVFNYSVSNGNPKEYLTFLGYAKSLKGESFDNILLALDFVGYGLNEKNDESNALLIENIQTSYFLTKYLSTDMFIHSLKTLKSSIFSIGTGRFYDRHNNAYMAHVDYQTTISTTQWRSKKYYLNMAFDDSYFLALKTLKAKNPESKFIVFTNPVGAPFLESIYSDPVLKEKYFHWVREMVFIFNEVYFFTFPNTFSENYMTLSKDGDHYYKDTLRIISKIVTSQQDIHGFGVLLTKENLDSELDKIRKLSL
jgi:hypothetical protein